MVTTAIAKKTPRVIVAEREQIKLLSAENIVLFGIAFCLYGTMAYYIVIGLGLNFYDTVSRSALGYFVVYSRDPHLASIGFVWTPLVSMMEIPFFPLLRIWNHPDFAACIITVSLGAATLPLLNQMGKQLKIHHLVRLPIIAFFAIHPFIAMYAALGMTETVFFFLTILTYYGLFQWVTSEKENSAPILVGVAVATSFWVRYEALPLLAGVCAFMVVVCYSQRKGSFRYFLRRTEGVLLVVIVPTVYSLVLWILANWLIMGDPLFFWSGQYTNAAYADQLHTLGDSLSQSVGIVLSFISERVLYLSAIFPALIIMSLLLGVVKKSIMPLAAMLIPLAILAFHLYLLFKGQSFGWLRYYTYVIPSTVPVIFWLLTFMPKWKGWRWLISSFMIAGMAVTVIIASTLMFNANIAKDEYRFVAGMLTQGAAPQEEYLTYASGKKVARYIEDNKIEGPVLVDTYLGFPIVLFSKNPKQFIITQDQNFREVLADPIKAGVRWVLVPETRQDRFSKDLILSTYPGFNYEGTSWAKLVQRFDEWRLYQVTLTDNNVEQSGT